MITSVKKYGSYVLTKTTLYLEDLADHEDDPEYISTCQIPTHWTECTLLKIIPYNHDTSMFRFALPEGTKRLNLPPGAFLFILAPKCEHDGSDAIRPYTSVTDDDVQNNPNSLFENVPSFDIMCKRYDEWGKKENPSMNFLFTKTDHSYRPPGAVSNYIHRLKVGDKVKFKRNILSTNGLVSAFLITFLCQIDNRHSLGRIPYPFPEIRKLMMIAVGVGIAPFLQMLRHLFKSYDRRRERLQQRGEEQKEDASIDLDDIHLQEDGDDLQNDNEPHIDEIVLFYGVRTVKDILMRELLEEWQMKYAPFFKIVFCVGSRWNNIHFGAKKKQEYIPPPPPDGFTSLRNAELGWISEEKIAKYAFPPANDLKILICGLPGVYEKICGNRESQELSPDSALSKLGYHHQMVIKL